MHSPRRCPLRASPRARTKPPSRAWSSRRTAFSSRRRRGHAMALPANIQRTSYPLALYNFRVKVAEISMSFTEVSGIAIDHDHVTYRHGLSFAEGEHIATFYFDSFVPITCKRGAILGGAPL